MGRHRVPDFIVVDDDPINNIICSKIIQKTLPKAKITTFTDPETGLAHTDAAYSNSKANNAILLLDINMPTLSGWEVLEKFESFSELIKQRFRIFMLSSSVDPRDKQRAANYPMVAGYIEKSFSEEKLQDIIPQIALSKANRKRDAT